MCEKLRKQKDYLEKLIKKIKVRLDVAPDGSLHILTIEGKPRYYRYSGKIRNKGNRIYLNKSQSELIKALAQKEYDHELILTAQHQLKYLDSFLAVYDPEALKSVYSALPEEKKSLVNADIFNDEEYVKAWEAVEYTPKSTVGTTTDFVTMKGERVRSKSELIIADRLNSLKIPYRYEYPLKMYDGRIISPDFLLLNPVTRQEYFLEHFGRMDDIQYINGSVIPKMRSYMQSSIFPGENLLITMESSVHPFSIKDLDILIRKYFGEII